MIDYHLSIVVGQSTRSLKMRLIIVFLLISLPTYSLALKPGQIFPDVEVVSHTAHQQPVKLSSLLKNNEYTYVEIWATWCAVCRLSFSYLNDWQMKYKDKGFSVLALSIDVDDELEDKQSIDLKSDLGNLHKMINAHLQEVPANFDIAYGDTAKIVETIGIGNPPHGLLLDKQGKVIFSHKGFNKKDAKKLEAKIAEIVSKG